MGVAVDEAGNGQLSPAVDDLIIVFVFEVAVDLRDLAIFDENIPTVQKLSGLDNGDVFYQHQRKICGEEIIKIIESQN